MSKPRKDWTVWRLAWRIDGRWDVFPVARFYNEPFSVSCQSAKKRAKRYIGFMVENGANHSNLMALPAGQVPASKKGGR